MTDTKNTVSDELARKLDALAAHFEAACHVCDPYIVEENADDRERHGRTSRGSRHSAAIKNSNQAAGTRAFRQRQREGRANV